MRSGTGRDDGATRARIACARAFAVLVAALHASDFRGPLAQVISKLNMEARLIGWWPF